MAKGRGFWDEVAPKDKRKISKDGFKKALSLFKFMLPYKKTYLIGIVFLVFSTLTTVAFPLLIGEMTKVMEGKSQFTINQVAIYFGSHPFGPGNIFFFQSIFLCYRERKTRR